MSLLNLDVSFIFLALCVWILLGLTIWIGTMRGRLGVLRGDGGHPELLKAIRLHANFAETAPLICLMVVAADLFGAPNWWLWAAVASFAVGRIYHFVRDDRNDRDFGMVLSLFPRGSSRCIPRLSSRALGGASSSGRLSLRHPECPLNAATSKAVPAR